MKITKRKTRFRAKALVKPCLFALFPANDTQAIVSNVRKDDKYMVKIKQKIISILLTATMILPMMQKPVHADGGTSGAEFTVTGLKVTSSPVEEENDFTVESTYHAKISTYGWDETVWNSCG